MQNVISVIQSIQNGPFLPFAVDIVCVDNTQLFHVSRTSITSVNAHIEVMEFLKAHDAFDGVAIALDAIQDGGCCLNNAKQMLVSSALDTLPNYLAVKVTDPVWPILFEVVIVEEMGGQFAFDVDVMFQALHRIATMERDDSFDFVEAMQALMD